MVWVWMFWVVLLLSVSLVICLVNIGLVLCGVRVVIGRIVVIFI